MNDPGQRDPAAEPAPRESSTLLDREVAHIVARAPTRAAKFRMLERISGGKDFVLKTVDHREASRGFESLPLRLLDYGPVIERGLTPCSR